MKIDFDLSVSNFKDKLTQFWPLAAGKVNLLDKAFDPSAGSPVYTVEGRYTTRGWTEWTQGFQYGIPLLVFDATGEPEMLAIGRTRTLEGMSHHISHFGVHDHGFNNLSTYGNLLRLANLNRFEASREEKAYYELALKLSGAVQARRWSSVEGRGFIYSFNGPHSLFIDTLRTCRILLLAYRLGHRMLDEHDAEISLLERAVNHGLTTAKHAVYYGEGRDRYDVWGRVAHESIFNMIDGRYRCPNAQQGYSGFTTWTRGLSWGMLGFAEFLEFLEDTDPDFPELEGVRSTFLRAAKATCDFYIENTAKDGIPYWDTGAPELHRLGKYQDLPADPYNDYEPVDSSAAAIGAQGLLRLGKLLRGSDPEASARYFQAGLTTLGTLLEAPYLSTDEAHQGILLHSVYHRPNGWDYIPKGSMIPNGESSMWGDYHLAELCLTTQKIMEGEYYTFYQAIP
jgi:unsaturated chondroitin disaccharide hydrolase